VDREFVLSLTAAQLELFLSSFAAFGDGVRLSTGMRYRQSEPERLDAVELAAVLTGRAVRRVAPVPEQADRWGGISGGLHGLTVSDSPRRAWMQPSKADSAWEEHEGTVWCPTTQNGTWFARRGRTVYFTGNSVKYSNAIIINEDLYKAHIEPMVLTFVDALTTVYLRPMLRSAGFSEEDARRMVVWYDPSEIVVRPNRADDATSGYDRYLLGPKAWLREHGFSENDMPTEEEIAMMLASAKATPPPDVTAALYQAVLPGLLGAKRAEAVASAPVPFPKSALDALGGAQ
jgi:hypothetical protein